MKSRHSDVNELRLSQKHNGEAVSFDLAGDWSSNQYASGLHLRRCLEHKRRLSHSRIT